MAYFSRATVKADLDIAAGDSTYDSLIDTWGAEADDEIDNAVASLNITIPLTDSAFTETATWLANLRCRARWYEFQRKWNSTPDQLGADDLNKQFETKLKLFLERLTRQSVELISQSSYNTWPANSDKTPYRSPGFNI